jgi:archaellum component FlaC
MCIIDGYREDAIDEIERVKNTGDLKRAHHLMDILKESDDYFNVKKESIKKVFKDDLGVMESIENIEKEIKKTNYKILKDIM